MTFRYEARNGGVAGGFGGSCSGRCLLKDLGRALEVLARMRGAVAAGKRHRRQRHRLGCCMAREALEHSCDSPQTAIQHRKLRHVAEEAPTKTPARDLSTPMRPDKMRQPALMSHTNP